MTESPSTPTETAEPNGVDVWASAAQATDRHGLPWRELLARIEWHDEALRSLRFSLGLPPAVKIDLVRMCLEDVWQWIFALHGHRFVSGRLDREALERSLPSAVAAKLSPHLPLYVRVCALEHQHASYQAQPHENPRPAKPRGLERQARKFLADTKRLVSAEAAKTARGSTRSVALRRGALVLGVAMLFVGAWWVLGRPGRASEDPSPAQLAAVPVVEPPYTIRMGTPEARRHMGAGWSDDEGAGENAFVWANDDHSVLFIRLSRRQPIRVVMRCQPFNYPGAPPQTLSLHVNDINVQVTDGPETDHRTYVATIPGDVLRPGINRIDLEYAYAQVVHEADPQSKDYRALSMNWTSIAFLPAENDGS